MSTPFSAKRIHPPTLLFGNKKLLNISHNKLTKKLSLQYRKQTYSKRRTALINTGI